MTKTEIAKRVLGTAASLGAGKIVHSIVKNNVQTTTQLETVSVAVGSFAIGGAVAEVAKNQMSRTVDEVVAAFQSLKSSTTTESE